MLILRSLLFTVVMINVFLFKVKVGNEITTGTGPNKKIAKRNAAEAMLLQLGYKASTPLQDQTEKVRSNCYN